MKHVAVMHQSFVTTVPSPGEQRVLLFFVHQFPAITQTLQGKQRQFPPQCFVFYIVLSCLPRYIKTPAFPNALRGQCKSKNTAHFYGYHRPLPGLQSWLQVTGAFFINFEPNRKNTCVFGFRQNQTKKPAIAARE